MDGSTLCVGEVYGETCVDGWEEEVSVSGACCVEHAVCKVEGVGWERLWSSHIVEGWETDGIRFGRLTEVGYILPAIKYN